MKKPKSVDWKEVGWNGLCLRIPPEWRPAKIGKRYLMFENGSSPVLEVRWEPVRGAFSPRHALRHMDRLYKKSGGGRIEACPLPNTWQKALARNSGGPHEAYGFCCEEAPDDDIAILLHSPCSGHAFLFRLYGVSSRKSDPVSAFILESADLAPEGENRLWSLFDIRAILPRTYHLTTYRFSSGEFELAFAEGRNRLSLYRWGPASVLMGGREGLARFAGKRFRVPVREVRQIPGQCSERVEWIRDVRGPGKWWPKIRPKPVFQAFRLWHVPARNRILGIRAEGKSPLPPALIQEICEHYEAI